MGNDKRFGDRKKPIEWGSKSRKEESREKKKFWDEEAIQDFDAELYEADNPINPYEQKDHLDDMNSDLQWEHAHTDDRGVQWFELVPLPVSEEGRRLRKRQQQRARAQRCAHRYKTIDTHTFFSVTFVTKECGVCLKRKRFIR